VSDDVCCRELAQFPLHFKPVHLSCLLARHRSSGGFVMQEPELHDKFSSTRFSGFPNGDLMDIGHGTICSINSLPAAQIRADEVV